jgi:hypothetical protein
MPVTLEDKYTLASGRVFLTGTQALVRLAMIQRERDLAAGLNTAGFISGYRGSPLGGFDQALWKARDHLKSHHVHFTPAVNEELAVTAVWGSQQVGLFEGPKYDGVYAMWYGKGPGVDRAGDAMKHANAAGSSKHGGVLMLAGDDHACKSSTLPHQSEHAFDAAMIPVLYPTGVQEIIELGLHGFAMSRYSGCYVAFKVVSETVDSSASIVVDLDNPRIRLPEDFILPPDGVHIRWPDAPMEQELRLQKDKIYAALAYARVNKLNRITIDSPNPRLGIIASGKSYLDVMQALEDLGIDARHAAEIGIRLYKVGMPWPLEPQGVREFAKGPGRDPCRRGEAPAHRVPDEGAALQPARRRAPARDRQVRRARRVGSSPRRVAAAGGGRAHAGDDRARDRQADRQVPYLAHHRGAAQVPRGEGSGACAPAREGRPYSLLLLGLPRITRRLACPRVRKRSRGSAATTWRSGSAPRKR